MDANTELQEQDIFSQNFLILDINQLKPDAPPSCKLLTDDDLEFSREHYDKPIKHGVVELDEKVFSIYTKSLLHTKSAI